jgi:hypothetical protein
MFALDCIAIAWCVGAVGAIFLAIRQIEGPVR